MSAPPSGSDQQIPSLPHTMSEPVRSISSDSATQPSLLNPGMATNPTSGLTLLEPPKPCGSKTSSSIFQDTTDSPAPDLTNRIDDAMQPINKTHAKVHDMSSLPHAHSSDQSSNSLSSPCFVHSYLDRGVALGESLKKQRRQLARQRRSKSSRQISQNDVASADDDSTPQSQLMHAQPTSQERKASSSSESPQALSSQSRSGLISTDRAQALATEDESLSSSDATSTYIKRRTERASARVRIRTSSDDDDDDDDDRDADNVAHQPLSDQDSSYGSSYSYSTDEEDSDKVRSLTRQLAETAVGVREMSKQLGRARVKSTIQSVMIITKARDNHLIKLTRELAIWLMTTPRNGKDTGLIVYVDSQLRQSKRFDAEGIRRDYPQLFDSRPKRTPSLSSSFSSTSGHDNNGSFNRTEGGNQLRFWNADMCSRSPHLFDFVVTLGGDGTVLFCSWLFQRIVPPVLPFALGSLGFLTNFDFKAYREVMKSALDDGIRVNLRMRFTATVYRATLPTSSSADRHRRQAIKSGKTGEIILNSVKNCGWNAIESPNPEQGHSGHRPRSPTRPDEEVEVPSMEKTSKKKGKKGKKCRDKEIMCFSTRPVETFEVLNDLVVDRGPSPYVSLLEVFGDEHHMTTAQADGLCISTPTGSTAYSLSAGGSLVHPEIPAILITPICPHTLSFRPMLLPDSMELRIAVPYNSRSTAWASFDGRGRVELKQGDHIKVTASQYPFPTVCAENQSTDWFSSISRTLKWNERQRQKSFVVVEEGADPDSGNNQEKGKDSASDASPNKMFAKHGHNGDQDSSSDDDEDSSDEDDDDEKGKDKEDEDAEKFDIDDTSTTVTRSNSPNSHGDGHVRRRSGQSTARHANGAPRRSSGPSLLSSSLPRLTSIANAFGPKPGEGHSSGHGHAKEGTSSTASSNPGSLLNSPDRFGLQGPPNPPKAISERHLANADFRLDGVRVLSSSSVPIVGSSSSKGAGSGSGSAPRAARTTECGRSWSSRDKPMTPSSALAREETPQGLRFDSVKEVGRRSIEQNSDRYDRSSNNDTGGTALVVYGEDESDSDSTTGAGH